MIRSGELNKRDPTNPEMIPLGYQERWLKQIDVVDKSIALMMMKLIQLFFLIIMPHKNSLAANDEKAAREHLSVINHQLSSFTFSSFSFFFFFFFSFFFFLLHFLFSLFFLSLLLIWNHFKNNFHRIFFYKEILCKFFPITFYKEISL